MQQPFSVWLRVVLFWVSFLKGQELMFFLSSRATGGDERWRPLLEAEPLRSGLQLSLVVRLCLEWSHLV